MSDTDAFKELLQSPIEPKRERRARPDPEDRSQTNWWPLVAGLVLGGLIVTAGYLAAGEGEEASAPQATTTSTAAPVAVPPTEIDPFPPGYTAVNDRTAVRVERVLIRPEEAIVSMTVAVRRGLDADATAGFWGGTWELLTIDGGAVQSSTEAFDPLARGAFSVTFPGSFAEPDIAGIRLTGEALRNTATLETEIEGEPLPFGEPATARFELDGNVGLIIDTIDLRLEGGVIEWHLEGDATVRGSVLPTVSVWTGTTPSGFPGTMPVRHFSSIASVFGSTVPAPFPVQADTLQLDPPLVNDPGEIVRVRIDWAVTWFSYVDTDVEISVGDAAVVVVDAG